MFLLNTTARAYQFAKRKAAPSQQQDGNGRYLATVVGCDVKRILPGLNLADASELKTYGVALDALPEGLEVWTPGRLPENPAKALVKKCASRAALEAWAAVESRDKVKAAIADHLKSFR